MQDYIITLDGAGTANWPPRIVRAESEVDAIRAMKLDTPDICGKLRKLPNQSKFRDADYRTFSVGIYKDYPKSRYNRVRAIRLHRDGYFVSNLYV